jgi:hypothetical protein
MLWQHLYSSRPEGEVMNRLAGIAAVVVLVLVGAAGYFQLNPHHVPRFISDLIPGFKASAPRSPMANFRPPQF